MSFGRKWKNWGGFGAGSMDYGTVRDIVARFANDALVIFSDPWSRWPEGPAAIQVAEALERTLAMWSRVGAAPPEAAAVCEAAAAVRAHALEQQKLASPWRKRGWAGYGASKSSEHQEVYNLEELAKWLGLPDPMDVTEGWDDYLSDYYTAGFEEALNEGASEAEAEEAGMEAQYEAEKEVYAKYTNGVEAAAAAILEPHHLELKDLGNGQYKVVPTDTWKDAAAALVSTINGVGMFYYEDAKELKDVGPYKSYKQAVLSHLHWATYYPEVYGTGSPRSAYESAWRY